GGKAGGARPGVGDLPTRRDALGGMVDSGLQLVPFAQALGQAHVRNAYDRQLATGFAGDIKALPVGAQRRTQVTSRLLSLTQVIAAGHGEIPLADRPPV